VAAKSFPKRYARAVFEIALENNELDKWQKDLTIMAGLRDDPVLLTLLQSPKLTFIQKQQLIDERIGPVSPMAHNLAYLLMSRNKMDIIKEIVEQYHHLIDVRQGTLHAMVTTAVPLEQADREKMRVSLQNLIGKQVILETVVDPSIVGGFVARINGTLLDGSTRSKLMALKRELVGTER
jgi:F-type H+-transporting ATPase subunit delta